MKPYLKRFFEALEAFWSFKSVFEPFKFSDALKHIMWSFKIFRNFKKIFWSFKKIFWSLKTFFWCHKKFFWSFQKSFDASPKFFEVLKKFFDALKGFLSLHFFWNCKWVFSSVTRFSKLQRFFDASNFFWGFKGFILKLQRAF